MALKISEVVAGLVLGQHTLMHGEHMSAGSSRPHLQIVALSAAGGDRQHYVGVLGGGASSKARERSLSAACASALEQIVRCPDGGGRLPPATQASTDVRIGHLAAVEVDELSAGLARQSAMQATGMGAGLFLARVAGGDAGPGSTLAGAATGVSSGS